MYLDVLLPEGAAESPQTLTERNGRPKRHIVCLLTVISFEAFVKHLRHDLLGSGGKTEF